MRNPWTTGRVQALMLRRLAVVLFALGLLRVLASEGTAAGQYPWSPSKTPTRRPTVPPTPTRPVVPTIAVTTPTPAPSSPPVTPVPSGGASIVFELSTVLTGVAVTGFEPVKYEAQVLGQWYTITPGGGFGKCWKTPAGECIAVGTNSYLKITGRDGSTRQGPIRLTQPRVLLAQAVGPVNLIQFNPPQIQ